MSRNIERFRDSEGPKGAKHIDEDTFVKFFNKELDSSEVNRVFQHLNQCDVCRYTATLYFHQIQHEEEIDDVLKDYKDHPALDPARLLDRLFASQERRKTTRTRNPLAELVQWLPSPKAGLRWAGALAMLVLVVAIWGQPAYKHWKSETLVDQSLTFMREQLTIQDRKALRPSGGFDYAEFGITRDAARDNDTALIHRLKQSIELDPQNARAYQLLGTYYLYFKNDLELAEEYYSRALSVDSTLAEVYNDLGVLTWRRSECKSAIPLFKKALALKPDFKEALYNLAMIYQKFPEFRQEALATWEAYLKLDQTSDWSKLARMHLEQLKNP